MNKIIKDLISEAPVITDGAWGTQLQLCGLRPGECPDSWNLKYPDRVRDVASAYINAGSQIILTNTFRSNRLALQSYGLEKKIKEINLKGVRISREVSKGRSKVFASVGPCAKLFMQNIYEPEELFDVYNEQIEILAEAGADSILLETMTNLAEVKIALRASKKTNLPVVVSISFDSGRDADLTIAGESPELIAKELTLEGADVIGANCGAGIEHYISIVKRLRACTDLPLWIKPSAGIPKVVQNKIVYSTPVKIFLEYAVALSRLHVSFIGGCCGTTPEYIQAIHHSMKKKQHISRE
ncbi:MAG: homocysteine S-methyltransferase family protein [Ignavibacteriales bacterium]|nr:homocysteine S-methyltransferase family protein [Ignavibacteriales bacterium]